MTDWDLRRALIDWEFGADGLWLDNRAYARDQVVLPDGSIAGPPQAEISAAAHEFDRVSESTRRALTSWNRLGEQLLGHDIRMMPRHDFRGSTTKRGVWPKL